MILRGALESKLHPPILFIGAAKRLDTVAKDKE
jgi:hypothetical protein